jgi:hypothetical protein
MEQEAPACSVPSHDPLLESDPSMEPDKAGCKGTSDAVEFEMVTTVRLTRVFTAIDPKSNAFALSVTLPPPQPARNKEQQKRKQEAKEPVKDGAGKPSGKRSNVRETWSNEQTAA